MRSFFTTILFLLLSAAASFAQPVYSPEVRAERELKWMQDSLHLTPAQSERLKVITLNYERNMDKENQSSNAGHKKSAQAKLMQKKDADVKKILNSSRKYTQYYKREKEIRRLSQITYDSRHRPL